MTLTLLSGNLSAEDRQEWIDFAALLKPEDLQLHLDINQDLEEYEICGILQAEKERRMATK
jgi:hypothetical protein